MRAVYHQRFFVLGGWFTWVAVAVVAAGAIGAGAAVVGSSKQASASDAATAQNAQNVSQANDQAWTSYLLSRGISTGSVLPAGTMPTGGYTAVNTKLPLWATVKVPTSMASGGGASLGGSLSGAGSTGGGYAPRGQSPGFGAPTSAPVGNPDSLSNLPFQSEQMPGNQMDQGYNGR